MAGSEADFLMFSGANLLVRTTVEGVLYGFTFALYIFCARLSYLQLKDPHRRRHSIITLLSMSLVMVCGLLGLAVDARGSQISFIDHADYPGGGLVYFAAIFAQLPIAFVGYAAGILIDSMTFGVQIWRLWVIWGNASRYYIPIVILPVLLYLACMAIDIMLVVVVTQPEAHGLVWLFIFESFGLSVPLVVTVLIIARIAVVRRQHIKVMGHSDIAGQYTSIISMLVESFALESVWIILGIIFTGLIFRDSPDGAILALGYLFTATRPFIQILAYLLVVYRVATGRGWKADTEEKLTSLRFNQSPEPRSTQFTSQASVPMSHEEA